MSAESGLKTFRDAGGLWEGHDVTKVATPEAWARDPALVLKFYNERRKQLLLSRPNEAHLQLAQLEKDLKVTIITQNVDDLHERAGSQNVVHLHGELRKVRSTSHPHLIYPCDKDIELGDTCDMGSQLRPHIVWFGEAVPMIEVAAQITAQADYLMIVGTSLQVYPAAGLMSFAQPQTPIYYVDPRPAKLFELHRSTQVNIIEATATSGVKQVCEIITSDVK